MWTATKITADAANKIQANAGLLLNNFDISNPTEPDDEDILFDTTGDFNIVDAMETEDWFEDINNAPKNTKEGLRITGRTCSLDITSVSITEEAIKAALGAVEELEDGGITMADQFVSTDFKTLTWIGDMSDPNKLLAIVMNNAVSTGGLNFTSTNNGKGGIKITFNALKTITDMTKKQMIYYLLEKVG